MPKRWEVAAGVEQGKRFQEWFVPRDDPRCVAIKGLFDDLRRVNRRAYGGDYWKHRDTPEDQEGRKLGQ